MKKRILQLLLALLPLSALAQALPADPKLRTGKLDNGLTYYIRHNELPEKRADFYIAQKVGSILEEDNQRGLAHFLEHMCFNGTEHFPGKTLITYLEHNGIKFGTNLNAYTSIDETVYNIDNVPVEREGLVDSCLLILRDWADGLTLAHAEIDAERGVIHEEWRTRSNASMRMLERALPTLFQESKYAYRLPIGLMEVVDNFPYQALRDYYEKWYRPDQQGIIVVGDIDVDKIEAKIKALFSPIKMPTNPAKREYFTVPDNKEPIVVVEKDKEQSSWILEIYHKHEAVPDSLKNSAQYLISMYMKGFVQSMLNARLSELTQTANPPYMGAQVSDGSFILAKTKEAFTGMVSYKEGGLETALSTLEREMERARLFGFTATEFERAKANFIQAMETAYNERGKTRNSSYVNEYVRLFIDNTPAPGIETEYQLATQVVPRIPLEAINQLTAQLMPDSNVVILAFCPEKEGVKYPTPDEILSIISKVKAEKLTPYEDKVSDQPLIAEKPKAGTIVKTEKGAFESTIWTLSNGVRVVIKPTDFKADEISMTAFSPGGSSLLPDKDILDINMLNQVVSLGGVGNFSQIELRKLLAGKNAGAGTSVGSLQEGASGSCAPKDLETMLQLLYLRFTAPRMDQEAFASFKQRLKVSLTNSEGLPNTALQDTLRKVLYEPHPRLIRLKADMVDNIDYDKIIRMYKERFADAGDFTFIFVGNIDIEAAKPLILTYLGSLPNIHRKENFRDTHIEMRKGQNANVFHYKLETPKATVVMIDHGTIHYSRKNAIIGSMVSQALNMIYLDEVREKEGASYGVQVSVSVSRLPKPEALMQIVFDTDPAKRAQMTKVVLDQLNLFVKNGPSAENLKKIKEYMVKSFNERLKNNSYWMSVLRNYYDDKEDIYTGYEQLINSITGHDLQKFTEDLLKQNNKAEVCMTSEEIATTK